MSLLIVVSRAHYTNILVCGHDGISIILKATKMKSSVRMIRLAPFKKNQQTAFSKLTEVQFLVLALAYSTGYFGIPGRVSTESLAKKSASTKEHSAIITGLWRRKSSESFSA